MARNKVALNNTLLITTLDDLVPADHLVRKLNQAVNWSYIHTLYDSLYGINGAPRVDPIIMFKIMILNIINGYQSIRRTCQEIEVNIAYRWFIGINLEDKVPNHSTLSLNYKHRYKEDRLTIKTITQILMKLDKEKVIDIDQILKRDQYFIRTKTKDQTVIYKEICYFVKHYLRKIDYEMDVVPK